MEKVNPQPLHNPCLCGEPEVEYEGLCRTHFEAWNVTKRELVAKAIEDAYGPIKVRPGMRCFWPAPESKLPPTLIN